MVINIEKIIMDRKQKCKENTALVDFDSCSCTDVFCGGKTV